jgi:hypothetical protein
LDIKTTSISEFEKEKKKASKNKKDNSGNNNEDDNAVNDLDSKLESLQKSLIIKKEKDEKNEQNEQNLKQKVSDNFEIIECDPYNKINARIRKGTYLRF